MGTSGSFGGSGGKDASDLRDNIAEWLDGLDGTSGSDETSEEQPRRPQIDLGPAIRLLLRSSGGGTSGQGSGGGVAGSGTDGGGRSSGGVARSIGRVSRAAGRAGRLALAYSSGDRETLREAGLNYDDLRALNDPLTVGLKIMEAAFDSQTTSTIEDAEEREIIAGLMEWMLVDPDSQDLSPEDVVRKTIEMILAETVLTEVTSSVHAKQTTSEERKVLEQEIRKAAVEYAAQANLNPTGATDREMAEAIENGIRSMEFIFGDES